MLGNKQTIAKAFWCQYNKAKEEGNTIVVNYSNTLYVLEKGVKSLYERGFGSGISCYAVPEIHITYKTTKRWLKTVKVEDERIKYFDVGVRNKGFGWNIKVYEDEPMYSAIQKIIEEIKAEEEKAKLQKESDALNSLLC